MPMSSPLLAFWIRLLAGMLAVPNDAVHSVEQKVILGQEVCHVDF